MWDARLSTSRDQIIEEKRPPPKRIFCHDEINFAGVDDDADVELFLLQVGQYRGINPRPAS